RPNIHFSLLRVPWIPEVSWHDSPDNVKVSVQPDFPADDLRIAPEHAAPKPVADYCTLNKSGPPICVCVDTSELRLHAEQREIRRAGAHERGSVRMITTGHVGVGRPNDGDFLEHS